MNMNWTRPRAEVQQFRANEYVSTCNTSTSYAFECNAGDKNLKNYPYAVFVDSNNNGRLDRGNLWEPGDTYLGNYHACGKKHSADMTDDFLNGFMYDERTYQITKVIIWRGEDGDNIHCTTNLDKTTWQHFS